MYSETATLIGRWARAALQHAEYQELSNGSWYGRVPGCSGAVATADSRVNVERELLSVLEDWALLGMQLGDEIPLFGETNLNTDEARQLAGSAI
jgi:hypothetical protein